MTDDKTKNPKTQRKRPPRCMFQWGGNWEFIAVVQSLSVKYTLFREDGVPVRATVDVTFMEADDVTVQKKTNPTSFVPRPGYKRREVHLRETLASIAQKEYGDANLWRMIADENAIDNPLSLEPGRILAIPPRS